MNVTLDQTLQKAIAAQNEGNIVEAESLYLSILETDPLNSDASHNLGILKISMNKSAAAIPLIKTAIEVNPNIDQYWISYSNALIKEKKFEEAVENYKKAIEFKPDFVEAHYNLGNILNSQGKLEQAEVSFKKAIELNPNFAEAFNNLSSTQLKLDKLEEAEVSYNKAKELNSSFTSDDKAFSSNLRKMSSLEKIINLNPNIKKALTGRDKNLTLSDKNFLSPSPLEYEEFYRKGMGTENVGGFLRGLAQMVRPNKILEIGAGYTTPFLLEALINNERVFHDGNLEESYFQKYDYAPKLVVIDDMSIEDLKKRPGMNDLINSKYIDFVEGKFEDKADVLFKKYGNFDFVWFDCGGPSEYEIFMDKYWNICSGYVLFHFTYLDGKPNKNHNIVLDKITGKPAIFDIVEPHKKRQGSITMVNKHLSKIS